MLPLDSIICGNNVEVLRTFPDECIDLTVTSPPYDNLRKYSGYTFDFEGVAQELWRVTKRGGVVVWVVGDATVNGSETGTSFRQALHFMSLGFKLHDTMIWHKPSVTNAGSLKCYRQAFEYMFILTKGGVAPNLIRDNRNRSAGRKRTATKRKGHGKTEAFESIVPEFSIRQNVWTVDTGYMRATSDKAAFEHPAIFPESLAKDHILSWSNEGDVVLDPFSGSGTTAKMGLVSGRHYIGIDVSEGYCGIARRRIEEAVARKAEEASRPVVEQVRLF